VSPAPLDTVSRRAEQRLQLRLLATSRNTDWRLVGFPSDEEEGDRGYVDLSVGGWRERVKRWQLVAAGTKERSFSRSRLLRCRIETGRSCYWGFRAMIIGILHSWM